MCAADVIYVGMAHSYANAFRHVFRHVHRHFLDTDVRLDADVFLVTSISDACVTNDPYV